MFRFIQKLSLLIVAVALSAGVLLAENPDKQAKKSIRVLMVGGGSSHDFDKWYKGEDVATLEKGGFAKVTYTSDPGTILSQLPETDVLFLANNQPISDEATRKAIFAFADAGKGLVLAHPAIWYNWKDWPEYNAELVGGGSRGHDKYGPFDVTVTNKKHPLTKGLPATFHLDDELYYFKADPAATPIEVLATGKAAGNEATYPSLFIVKHPKTRIVGIALGHDAASHTIEPYKTMIINAVKWASGNSAR